jgi:hypothetical protein
MRMVDSLRVTEPATAQAAAHPSECVDRVERHRASGLKSFPASAGESVPPSRLSADTNVLERCDD